LYSSSHTHHSHSHSHSSSLVSCSPLYEASPLTLPSLQGFAREEDDEWLDDTDFINAQEDDNNFKSKSFFKVSSIDIIAPELSNSPQ